MKLSIPLLSLFYSALVFAQFDTMSDVDARAIGMSGAVSALPGAVGVSENPASLGFLKQGAISITVNPMHLGIENGFVMNSLASFVYPFGAAGSVGAAAQVHFILADGTNIFSAYQATVSYGIALPLNIAVGAGFRLQQWWIPQTVTGTALGAVTVNANVGLSYRFFEHWYIAAAGINLLGLNTTSMNSAVNTDGLSSVDRLLKFACAFDDGALAVDIDVNYLVGNNQINLMAGGEYLIAGIIPVRAGIELNNLTSVNASVGVGYSMGAMKFDAAYRLSFAALTAGTFAASFSYSFGQTPPPAYVLPSTNATAAPAKSDEDIYRDAIACARQKDYTQAIDLWARIPASSELYERAQVSISEAKRRMSSSDQ